MSTLEPGDAEREPTLFDAFFNRNEVPPGLSKTGRFAAAPISAIEVPALSRIAYVDMNAFYASVEQCDRPSLRGKPVIVVTVDAQWTPAIAASYEAKRLGISTGTLRHDAERICPDIAVVLSRPERYLGVHAEILEVLSRHFPSVTAYSVDEMACRLPTGTSEETARRMVGGFKDDLRGVLGPWIRASVGVAANVFLAKIAADIVKPNGLTVLGDDAAQALAALPLTDFPGIGKKTAARLAAKRIYDVPDLYAASHAQLRGAMGTAWAHRWHEMIRGSTNIDYQPQRGTYRRSVGSSHVLAPHFRTNDALPGMLACLMAKSLRRLREHDLVASRLDLQVGYRSVERHEDVFGWSEGTTLPQGASDYLTWSRASAALHEKFPKPRGFVPWYAGVVLSRLERSGAEQLSAFTTGTEGGSRLSAITDSVNGRYGYMLDFGSPFFLRDEVPLRISFGPPDLSVIGKGRRGGSALD